MRPYLTALTVLLGVMLLYHGMALRGIIPGEAAPMAPAAAELLLAAAGAMGLAGLTIRVHSGLAAVEMALAGVVVLAIAGPDHRYLLAYGTVAVALAIFAAVDAVAPSSPRQRRSVSGPTPPPGTMAPHDAGIDPAHHRGLEASSIRQPHHDPAAARRVLRRVADSRSRRQAARQAWRSWRADPVMQQGEPPNADAPTAVSGGNRAGDRCVTEMPPDEPGGGSSQD